MWKGWNSDEGTERCDMRVNHERNLEEVEKINKAERAARFMCLLTGWYESPATAAEN